MKKNNTRDFAEFTVEMRKTHTILVPNMSQIHFGLLEKMFSNYGYNVELLTSTDRRIVDEGLKYVHNDTCYPALLAIGQLMDALHSGQYDLDKTALIMTQTGGGCRASNYIHLLRKALKKDGLDHIPVISLSAAGLESHSGFKVTLPMIRCGLAALVYGDLLMLLSNQCRPYEVNPKQTDVLVAQWTLRLAALMGRKKGYQKSEMPALLDEITASFAAIPMEERQVVKVGIVGEIYVKYSALANNHLEEFLASEDCEVMVPGLLGFMLYCADNTVEDIDLYGGGRFSRAIRTFVSSYLRSFERILIQSVSKYPQFKAPWPHQKLYEAGKSIINTGCKMGEGWLLTAEMVELIEHGYSNIVCTQPFGCLPNHIVGKGMIRKLREMYGDSNIVAIDYDPGSTRVNQENRIKLMLAVARENMSGTGPNVEVKLPEPEVKIAETVYA